MSPSAAFQEAQAEDSRYIHCLADPSLPPHPAVSPPAAAGGGLSPQYACALPYKLLHAVTLVELGLLPQAAQYCHNVLSLLQVR